MTKFTHEQTIFIAQKLQEELDKRFELLRNHAEQQPFSNCSIVKYTDVTRFVLSDFVYSVQKRLANP